MKGYKMCVFSILVYIGHGIITNYLKVFQVHAIFAIYTQEINKNINIKIFKHKTYQSSCLCLLLVRTGFEYLYRIQGNLQTQNTSSHIKTSNSDSKVQNFKNTRTISP